MIFYQNKSRKINLIYSKSIELFQWVPGTYILDISLINYWIIDVGKNKEYILF